MAHVLIYTKQSCPFCIKAKAYLKSLGVKEIEEKDVEESSTNLEESKTRSNGRQTVPQIFIDGKHIGGCDDLHSLNKDELASLLGKL